MGSDITLLVGLHDGEIDLAVKRGGRDGLELLDVEVGVDGLGGEQACAGSLVREDAHAGLEIQVSMRAIGWVEDARTVWMRIGRSPSLACLFLRPLRMAFAAGKSSESA